MELEKAERDCTKVSAISKIERSGPHSRATTTDDHHVVSVRDDFISLCHGGDALSFVIAPSS
jgi:hypothetical protein